MTETLARPARAQNARSHDATARAIPTRTIATRDIPPRDIATCDTRTCDIPTCDITTRDIPIRDIATCDQAADSAAAWDAWAARVDGERDIAVVLDAMPRAHSHVRTGRPVEGPRHPLAPVDGVLAAPAGVVGPFSSPARPRLPQRLRRLLRLRRPQRRPGRPRRLGVDRGFIHLTARDQSTDWGRLRLALLVAAALWCASNATTVVALTQR
ncbi:MAG: hypothetical protein ACRCXL_00605 [Dermatophilaceae bacterium]